MIHKPLFSRIVSLILPKEIVQGWKLCIKHFYFNQKTILGLSLIFSNMILGCLVPLQQNAFQTFINHTTTNLIPYNLLFRWIAIIISSATLTAMNNILCKKLREDLISDVSLIPLWIKSNTFFGIRHIKENTQIIDITSDLVHTTRKFCIHLILLTNTRLSTLSQFIGAFYALYLTAEYYIIKIWDLNFEIPYLIVFCLLYTYLYKFLSLWANDSVKNYIKKSTTAVDKLSKLTHNIQSQAQSKAFLDGRNFENDTYLCINNTIQEINNNSLLPNFFLSFLNKTHWEFSFFIIAITQLLIKGTLNGIDILTSGTNFIKIVKFACWEKENLESLKLVENCEEKLSKIEKAIKEFQTITNKCKIQYTNSNNTIKIDIKVAFKNKTETFEIKKELQIGKRYHIIGSNGAGKTTFFEIICKKMNPKLGSGEIVLPKKEKIFCIPQVPHILDGNHSLLDSIFYPQKVESNNDQINLIKELLLNFNFEEDVYEIKNWAEHLSLGQKQQIAIVAAIIKKPLLLLADEPFASLDWENYNKAIELFNKHLAHTCILYSSHKALIAKQIHSNDAPIQIIEEDFKYLQN